MQTTHTAIVAAVLAGLAVAAGAHAGPPVTETVVVTGSRALTETDAGRTTYGVPIKEVSLTYRVNVADLDAKTAAGRAEIEKRVATAAKAACDELHRLAMGNPTSPDETACVQQAVDSAMKSID